jgi:heptose I phosphotransferase
MKIDVIKRNDVFLNKDFMSFLDHHSLKTFEDFMGLEGTIAKSVVKERSTQRVNLGRRTIYLKKHAFVGIRETLENLLRFRLPRGALNEWRGILAFHAKGIPTMIPISAGRKSFLWGLKEESFLLTADLGDASRLDYFLQEQFAAPCRGEQLQRRRRILAKLADLTHKMHVSGINHRDYYLCHIFIDKEEELYVIDLHRVDIRKKVGRRWLVKDLAALLFSSLELPITWGERLAFYKRYRRINQLSPADKDLIRRVIRKCARIARHTEKMYASSPHNR